MEVLTTTWRSTLSMEVLTIQGQQPCSSIAFLAAMKLTLPLINYSTKKNRSRPSSLMESKGNCAQDWRHIYRPRPADRAECAAKTHQWPVLSSLSLSPSQIRGRSLFEINLLAQHLVYLFLGCVCLFAFSPFGLSSITKWRRVASSPSSAVFRL